MPMFDDVAEKLATLLDLAQQELEGRISTRIRMWEDGEFEIRVWHGYASPRPEDPVRLRAVLRHHSTDDYVEAAIMKIDDTVGEKKIVHRETIMSS